ncbi:hypothetical protein Tco_0770302 [Tanacetum coccineum]|uniref:Uncharacterized protein n=1 Tax=Tanacetum coccineum TaxID=301880 RepID=A0ABQ4ZD26_9ASTR
MVTDLNERDREEVGYEDDENEDMEDELRLHGTYVNEADREYDEDDENENIGKYETKNNNIESDDSEDEFGNEDVGVEVIQVPRSQKGTC